MNDESIHILVTGDYHVTNRFADYLKGLQNPASVFGELAGKIQSSDLAMTNIEFPVSETTKDFRLKMGMLAKAQPSSLAALRAAGFDLATIGNNHTYDYGQQGVADTLKYCKEYGLETVGAGLDLEAARRIFYRTIKGKKIAVLNFSENEYNVANSQHGGANPLNIVQNVYDIQEARRNADFVIVIIHGGPDFCHYPTPRMVEQYRFYADQGASAIIGHHSHVVSGHEIYNGTPIVYSLGNFIYPIAYDEERNETLVAELTIANDELQMQLHPWIFNVEKNVLEEIAGEKRTLFDKRIVEYSNPLNDMEQLRQVWGAHISKVDKLRYLVLISNLPYLVFRVFKKLKMLPLLERILSWNAVRFLPIWNLIRCETHRDAMLYFFDEKFDDINASKKYITKFNQKIYNVTREETH